MSRLISNGKSPLAAQLHTVYVVTAIHGGGSKYMAHKHELRHREEPNLYLSAADNCNNKTWQYENEGWLSFLIFIFLSPKILLILWWVSFLFCKLLLSPGVKYHVVLPLPCCGIREGCIHWFKECSCSLTISMSFIDSTVVMLIKWIQVRATVSAHTQRSAMYSSSVWHLQYTARFRL